MQVSKLSAKADEYFHFLAARLAELRLTTVAAK
jgi:hypothetical protein